MAIPKIIHYCWFGSKPIPELEKKCIESWHKYFPDYKIMFWNEETFDISSYLFAQEAYNKRQYAFVSDIARAVVLEEYGGIYLDTDMEILANISTLVENYDLILGFENRKFVGTAIIASIPNHKIITDFANYYKMNSFLSKNGDMEIITNPILLADVLNKNGIILDGKEYEKNKLKIYKREIFFPKKLSENSFNITEETVAIHHFKGSWLTPRQKKRGTNWFWIEICRPTFRGAKNIIRYFLGEKAAKNAEKKIKNKLR